MIVIRQFGCFTEILAKNETPPGG